jgi:capsular polysaccharide transport system permease protein
MATTLRRSFAIQRRVIGALVLREVITRYGRHNLGVLWMVVEPMMFTLGIVAVWSIIGIGSHSGLPLVPLALTGYTSILMWRNVASRCTQIMRANLPLMHHRNVRIFDMYVARIILEIGGILLSFFVLLGVFTVAGYMDFPRDVLSMALGLAMLTWFGVALAMIIGYVSEISEIADRVWHVLVYLSIPVTGAMYIVAWLPPDFRAIVLWFPMVHGAELLRSGIFGSVAQFYFDLPYLCMVNGIITVIGLLLIRDLNKRAEP